MAHNNQNKITIAAAGAIPRLVRLLEAGSPPSVQGNAARALAMLALNAANAATIAGAGAINPVVQLMLAPCSDGTRAEATVALEFLRMRGIQAASAALAVLSLSGHYV
ncbi:hypothetical protein FOA52_013670 [Chlamydomonas sp. UWO 241]|nr:hypothetical protein FOA52_013670 [Chlamydomonas sp. UWO 241]